MRLELPFAAIASGRPTLKKPEDVDSPSENKPDDVAPPQTFLGEGQFAEVYLTADERHVIKRSNENSQTARNKFEHEIKVLTELGEHENIVSYVGHYIQGGLTCIIFNYFESTELFERIESGETGLNEFTFNIWQQMLSAIVYLHDKGILHRDIKPENMLVGANGLKIIDFGEAHKPANIYVATPTAPKGTLGYMHPSTLEGKGTSAYTELFAVASTCLVMLTKMGIAVDTGINPADIDEGICQQYKEMVEQSHVNQMSRLSEMCDDESLKVLFSLIMPMLALDQNGSAKSCRAQVEKMVLKEATSERQARVRFFPESPPEKRQSENSPQKPRGRASMGGA